MLTKNFKKLKDKYSYLKVKLRYKTLYPSGHYYSPIPSQDDIKARAATLFDQNITSLVAGVDLNTSEQLELLDHMKEFYKELPFTEDKTDSMRYYYNNIFYGHSDVISLYGIMRQFRPKKIIEVGSGFSSAAILDINDRFFNRSIKCRFIEPYPNRLRKLLNDDDKKMHTINESIVQEVTLDTFAELEENDMLFIDSSHVAKTGSDLNYILFDVLPVLKKGVIIHFHDIFYPFEYPKEWVLMGRAWNECYFLRAFLQYNNAFKIIFYNTYLQHTHPEWFEQHMPLCLKKTIHNGSIWLRKLV